MLRTVDSVIAGLSKPSAAELPAPAYTPASGGPCVGMCVPSMQHHTTDEGWQLFQGLSSAGYLLAGHGMPLGVDARSVVTAHPRTVLLQDKREWDGGTAGPGFDPRERFLSVDALNGCGSFVLTVLKDAHARPEYHAQSAREIGCHAWVVYYHPRIVHHLAPYTRAAHCVRTYHSVDSTAVPPWTADRRKALLSGAVSGVYPLRRRLFAERQLLPGVDVMQHPGYGRAGCCTPEYLRRLGGYRVAVCTASVYGYALRKLIEATACGCRVLTDLPVDDPLPGIDGNLVRIDPSTPTRRIAAIIDELAAAWNEAEQREYAEIAKQAYSYGTLGWRLMYKIEEKRLNYGRP